MKVAVVHDWFNEIGGAEKVVREILFCYPDADVYCLFDFLNDEKRRKYINNKTTSKTFLQHFPLSKRFYRFLFPLFPRAIETLKLDKYDLIISSSYCVAKGIKKNKHQLHICYCHSPVRYAWDLKQEYLDAVKEPISKFIFSRLLNNLRKWDKRTSNRVDYFIANSKNVSNRIKQNYNREAVVIYPPVDINKFKIETQKQNYYVTVSRLVSYKKTELLLKAFKALPDLKLKVVGDGPNRKKLLKLAPKNVEILGFVENKKLIELIKNAKAFLAAANEDFGITIVEAQASGTPVIVPYLGGYKESVSPKTGLFFKDQNLESIISAIKQFEAENKKYEAIDFINNVMHFSKEKFHQEFTDFVNKKYKEFKDA